MEKWIVFKICVVGKIIQPPPYWYEKAKDYSKPSTLTLSHLHHKSRTKCGPGSTSLQESAVSPHPNMRLDKPDKRIFICLAILSQGKSILLLLPVIQLLYIYQTSLWSRKVMSATSAQRHVGRTTRWKKSQFLNECMEQIYHLQRPVLSVTCMDYKHYYI